MMRYYKECVKKSESVPPIKEVNLLEFGLLDAGPGKNDGIFQIMSKKRTYALQACFEFEREDWIAAFRRHIKCKVASSLFSLPPPFPPFIARVCVSLFFFSTMSNHTQIQS